MDAKNYFQKYVILGKDYFHWKIKFVKDGNPLVVLVVGTFFSNLYKNVKRENSLIMQNLNRNQGKVWF